MKIFYKIILISLLISYKFLITENIQMKSNKIKIETNKAPAPIGPYSQAVLVNNTLYISGQIPFDIQKKEIVTDVKEATNLIMNYLKEILKSANMDFNDVVKTSIFLMDMKDFPIVNEIYSSHFQNIDILPARETTQVAALPKNSCVEISMIAVKN